jgi:hypothetical protein
MASFPPTFGDEVIDHPDETQFEALLNEYRRALNGCLDGLAEKQVRRSLVPSATTLLGLVKHATFVQKVWFDEAHHVPVAGRDRYSGDARGVVHPSRRRHDRQHPARAPRCLRSLTRATSALSLDDLVHGNLRGPLPLRWA